MLEIICVALAVYFESRSEPYEGQLAVASVVWNRRNDPRWPNHTCEVFEQAGQFDSYPHDIPKDLTAWRTAIAAASQAADTPSVRSLFFAAPGSFNYPSEIIIENHEFYLAPMRGSLPRGGAVEAKVN